MGVRFCVGVAGVALAAACSFDASGLPASGPGGADAATEVDAAGQADARRPEPDAARPDAAPSAPPGTIVATVTGDPPALDGNLGEWDDATFVRFTMDDAAELLRRQPGYEPSATLSIAAMHDDHFIYFAVIVEDDLIVSDSNGDQVYEDDAVSLFFDGLGDQSGPWDVDDHEVVVGSDSTWNDYGFGDAVDLGGDVVATASGYTLELSVARASLAGGELRERLGFDVAINDDDGIGNTDGDGFGLWFVAEPPHCDVCCEAEAQPEAWCDTTVLGTLLLE